MRAWMQENLGISAKKKHLGTGIVTKWIGFCADEVSRIKSSEQQYVCFDYPLIRMGLDKQGVLDYYAKHDLPIPPRSVCNACFANSVSFLKEMYETRPKDWEQAVAVDDAIRDFTQVGVDNDVYVSQTVTPLRRLPIMNWTPERQEDLKTWSCESGYCFI